MGRGPAGVLSALQKAIGPAPAAEAIAGLGASDDELVSRAGVLFFAVRSVATLARGSRERSEYA
ncbi:hypothetical protein [Microbacterium marmarense]|uniref:Uncharacterized protein n=1 Tax=Microbacterium marmarense TaxID=3122051 RepID=A0ABU8LSD9_9MICO